MTKLSHQQWYEYAVERKAALDASPNDFELANSYWEAISRVHDYDVRNGRRLLDTFRVCALESDQGLALLLHEFRKLTKETLESPQLSLIDPPLQNLLRHVACQRQHELSENAAWMLSFLHDDM